MVDFRYWSYGAARDIGMKQQAYVEYGVSKARFISPTLDGAALLFDAAEEAGYCCWLSVGTPAGRLWTQQKRANFCRCSPLGLTHELR